MIPLANFGKPYFGKGNLHFGFLYKTCRRILPVVITISLMFLLYRTRMGERIEHLTTAPQLTEHDEIHIAVTLHGMNAIYNFRSMLKSLLYFRGTHNGGTYNCLLRKTSVTQCPKINRVTASPLVVHVILDESTKLGYEDHIKSWADDHVQLIEYEAEKHLRVLKLIPNTHPAGVWGLLKLEIPSLLPETVSKVIVVDCDTLWNADVQELWLQFNTFTENQSLSFAREQSADVGDCDTGLRSNRPEAGVNGGVALMNLENLRESGWWQLWRSTVAKILLAEPTLKEGEQTVYNAIRNYAPFLFGELPCEWNIQLWDQKAHECCPVIWPDLNQRHKMQCKLGGSLSAAYPNGLTEAKIIHYNSAQKPDSRAHPPARNPKLSVPTRPLLGLCQLYSSVSLCPSSKYVIEQWKTTKHFKSVPGWSSKKFHLKISHMQLDYSDKKPKVPTTRIPKDYRIFRQQ
ncbi:glycosyltransferase-like protein LARGE [Clonorchis sinensis]|uniref:Glycosyltransferase-like protein LARGE n=1 Tax=Clonorchis sinensis TaxID=79923 RepID=G7YE81_CLOSI|nr:glycosyltransferase-like protein LARGE [Clonorchis sinensis]